MGYSLAPPTSPSLFEQSKVAEGIEHYTGDVRDADNLSMSLAATNPDIVFHLAAQPLVIDSYAEPVETFATNVTGSINLMEAVRMSGMRGAVVMVTTDKAYLNREWEHAYREDDPLGGHDPYSASKAALEIAVASWRASFFNPAKDAKHGVRLATARSGNVIGGGDWSTSRLIPDLIRSVARNDKPTLRNAGAKRPWQHVLEPLAGYLYLGAKLAGDEGPKYAESWNFDPQPADVLRVGELADAALAAWGTPGWTDATNAEALHEAGLLRLAIDKSVDRLGWRPVWDSAKTVQRTVGWYKAVTLQPEVARAATLADLDSYLVAATELGLPFATGSVRSCH